MYTTPNEFSNATITGHLGFCLRKTRTGKSHEITYRDTIVFEKLLSQFFFFMSTGKQKAGVFNSSGWKSVFEKLSFRDGLPSMLAGLHSQMSHSLHIASNGPFPLPAGREPHW